MAMKTFSLKTLPKFQEERVTKIPNYCVRSVWTFIFQLLRKAPEITKLLVCFADSLGLDKPLNFWMFIQAELEVFPYLVGVILHKNGNKFLIYWPLVTSISICKTVSAEWLQLSNISTSTYFCHLPGKMTRANEKKNYMWLPLAFRYQCHSYCWWINTAK